MRPSRAHLVDQARARIASKRVGDRVGQRVAVDRDAEHRHRDRRRRVVVDAGTERRERPAGELDHLERAHDAPPVAGLHARRRDRIELGQPVVRTGEPGVSVRGGVERIAHRLIGRRDLEVVDHGAHVETGAAHEQRPLAARFDVGDRGAPRPACAAPTTPPTGSATSTRWCTTSARSAGVGLAVPMSRPRYTCIESSETISTSPDARARAPAPTCPTRSGRRARDVASNGHNRDAHPPPGRGPNPSGHLAAQPVGRRARDAHLDEIARRSSRPSARSAAACCGAVRPDHIAGSVFDGPSTSTSSTSPSAPRASRARNRSTTSISRCIRSRNDFGGDEVVGHRRGFGARAAARTRTCTRRRTARPRPLPTSARSRLRSRPGSRR